MVEHHRNYRYRPARRERRKASSHRSLRFIGRYLLPFKWRILLASFLIGANACSVYLMAFYTRIVVDNVLVIQSVEAAGTGEERPESGVRRALGTSGADRLSAAPGISRRLEALPPPALAPEAGRRLFLMFLLWTGSVVALNGMERVAQRIQIETSRSMACNLREDMHEKVLDQSVRYHQSTTPGRLLSRITSDVEVIQKQAMHLLLLLARTTFMLLVGLVVLLSVDWRIGVAFFCVAPLYAVLNGFFRQRIRHFNRELRHTNSCLYSYVAQKIEGVKVVHSYVREGLERLNMHRLASCFLRDSVKQQGNSALMQSLARIISGATSMGIFLFCVRQVLAGEMTVGNLLMVQGAVASLFMPIISLTHISIISSNLQVVTARMMDVVDAPLEIKDAPDAKPLPHPLKTGISLHNVSFTYGDPADSEPALRNINLEVPAGRWLCLMGASGSGKSTLLFLLARLYEVSGGVIAYDGIALEKISLDSLRRKIGFVPQTPQIFSGTVRDNLTYGKPTATPGEIMAAAKMAEVHDFIMGMKVKYETIVGERGTSLSGGQRQRVALARALLTNPDILLLDDCTSSLDAATEARIQQTLARTLAGKTAVIASQRVSMAQRCHRIAVLDNGVVSEYGTHEQLVRNDGFYARLHRRQTAGDDAAAGT